MIESAGRDFITFRFSWGVRCWVDGDALPEHCALTFCEHDYKRVVVNVIHLCALIVLPLWGSPGTLRHHTGGRNILVSELGPNPLPPPPGNRHFEVSRLSPAPRGCLAQKCDLHTQDAMQDGKRVALEQDRPSGTYKEDIGSAGGGGCRLFRALSSVGAGCWWDRNRGFTAREC